MEEKAGKKKIKEGKRDEEKKDDLIREIRIENKHNFPYELKLGRDYIRFEPRRDKENSYIIRDKKFTEHKDWKYFEKHFIVQEVKG
jgi:hypothetical protein